MVKSLNKFERLARMGSYIYPNGTFDDVSSMVDSFISPVDQLPVSDFNIGPNGFPQSDITSLMTSNNNAVYESILQGMQELKVDNSFDGLTDNDKLALVKPRILQDPIELQGYYNYVSGYIEANSIEVAPSVDNDSSIDIDPSEDDKRIIDNV